MNRSYTACLMAFLGSAAAAETCVFTVECFEDETCQETSFSLAIEGDTLVTDAETIPVNAGGSETTGVFVGYTSSAFHVLTREVDGPARYSTHIYDDMLMVNYMGTCE